MTINPAHLGAFLRMARTSDASAEHQMEDGTRIVVRPGEGEGQEKIVEQRDADGKVMMAMNFYAADAAGFSEDRDWPHVAGHRCATMTMGEEVLLIWPEGGARLYSEVVAGMRNRGWEDNDGGSAGIPSRTDMRRGDRSAAVIQVEAGPVNMVMVEGLRTD